jgi:hypothetical protein
VNGFTGSVKYLFNTNSSYMGTHDLTYFLFEYDDRGLFVLADIEKNEFVRTIEWRKSDRVGPNGYYRIFRSLDSEYDFRIDFNNETEVEAIAYYNIEQDYLETIFDVTDTGAPEEYSKKREKILPEELGR